MVGPTGRNVTALIEARAEIAQVELELAETSVADPVAAGGWVRERGADEAPRGPTIGGGNAGFEVRCAGRHPGTHVSATVGSAAAEDVDKGPWPAPRVDAIEAWQQATR